MAQTIEERRAYWRAYYLAHLEECKRREHIHYQAHKKQHAISNQRNYEQLKLEVLSHYSDGAPKCNYCGIIDIDVLSIDHINNDGAEHRRLIGKVRPTRGSIYCWLRRNDYPKGFQVLCYNCNMKKEIQYRRVRWNSQWQI